MAARNRRNPILQFLGLSAKSAWSWKWPNNFLKKFQNRPKSPKISRAVLHSPPPQKKFRSPEPSPIGHFAVSAGGWGFRASDFCPSRARRLGPFANGPGPHKIGSGSVWTALAVKYRAPPAPATPSKPQASSQLRQTTANSKLQTPQTAVDSAPVKYRAPPAPATLCFQEGGGVVSNRSRTFSRAHY